MLDVNRKELKYLVGAEEVGRLSKRLGQVMEPDPNNRNGSYTVRSLYFDTVADADYRAKLDGLDARRKIRIRIYNGRTNSIKLELKAKNGDFQRKRSLSLSLPEAEQMICGEYAFLFERPEGFAHGLYTLMETQAYRPKCIVEYDRMAFVSEHNDIRVTFDMRLRALEDPEDFFRGAAELYPVADPAQSTLEVKYNGFLFSYIRRVLSTADRPRVSNSKYIQARNFMK